MAATKKQTEKERILSIIESFKKKSEKQSREYKDVYSIRYLHDGIADTLRLITNEINNVSIFD